MLINKHITLLLFGIIAAVLLTQVSANDGRKDGSKKKNALQGAGAKALQDNAQNPKLRTQQLHLNLPVQQQQKKQFRGGRRGDSRSISISVSRSGDDRRRYRSLSRSDSRQTRRRGDNRKVKASISINISKEKRNRRRRESRSRSFSVSISEHKKKRRPVRPAIIINRKPKMLAGHHHRRQSKEKKVRVKARNLNKNFNFMKQVQQTVPVQPTAATTPTTTTSTTTTTQATTSTQPLPPPCCCEFVEGVQKECAQCGCTSTLYGYSARFRYGQTVEACVGTGAESPGLQCQANQMCTCAVVDKPELKGNPNKQLCIATCLPINGINAYRPYLIRGY